MKEIYLDNAATTKVREEVIKEMIDSMANYYANADASHDLGTKAAKKIKEEKKVFKKFGLDENRIFFTAGGGDANNIAIQSVVKAHKKGHVLTTKIEHPSVMETFKNLENVEVEYIPVDSHGFVKEDELEKLIRKDTILVSIAFVNSELGTIQDIEKLANIVKSINKDTVFHTDFVQGLGHVDVNFSNMKVDAISFSSHKIYGPKGIGALYLSKNIKVKKVVFGSNLENALIPRTMPNEMVLGFLKAINCLKKEDISYLNELKSYAIKRFLEIDDVIINSPEKSSPAILNVGIKGVMGEIILNYLSEHNIYISTGSACSSKKGTSYVIKEIGLEKCYENGVIRISFGIYNKKEEIDEMIKRIKEIVAMMRG